MSQGSVRKDHNRGSWYYVFWGPRPGGGRKQYKARGFANKADAVRAMRERQVELDSGLLVDDEITLGEYFDEVWAPTKRTQVRPSTWDSYESNLRLHALSRIGHIALADLRPDDFDRLYADLLASGRRQRSERGLSPRTVRYIHGLLNQVLAHAVTRRRLARNPLKAVDPPKAQRPEVRPWDTKELSAFLTRVVGDRLHTLWLLYAATGARRGELLGLMWSDVDLTARTIQIQRSLTQVRYHPQLCKPKTARGRRLIMLDEGTVRALRAWRSRQAAERLAGGPQYERSDFVFTTESGRPYNPERISRLFKQAVSTLGLRPTRLHDLRHAHATLLLAGNTHPKVVQERLGHAQIGVTLDTYSHATPGMQEQAALAFEVAIDRAHEAADAAT